VIGVFRQKSPANILLLLIVGVLIKLPAFIHPHPAVIHSSDGYFYTRIVETLNPSAAGFPLLYPLLAFLLLFLQANLLTRFINQHRMMNRLNYLPGLAYIVVTSLLPDWNYFSASLLANTILLYILPAIFNTYNKPQARGSIFNIGLALGIASFFYSPIIFFGLWVILALSILRPFKLNEWLLCILGITTPYYFLAIYLVLTDSFSWEVLLPQISIGLPKIQQSAWMAGSVFLIMVPFLVGGYYVQDHLRRMLIQVRKGWSILLFYLLIALLIPFVNTGNSLESWIMALLPMAAFHAFGYMHASYKILPLIFFWASVILILAYQYAGPGW
jgi:hypothetical protein